MTFLRNILLHIFPPARKPVGWVDTWPLVLFVVLFGGIVGGVWWQNQIDFVYPWAFLLLLFTPWIWWMQAAGHLSLIHI